MIVGSLLTMVFMFAYSAVKTSAENLGLSCAVNICLNIYYGTLFAYTPEHLPSAHRATGNGISVAAAGAIGTIAPVVAFYSHCNVCSYICYGGSIFGDCNCKRTVPIRS
jgi:hypothetical protein